MGPARGPAGLVSLFSSRNFPNCQRPSWPKNPVFRDFPPVGVQSAKTENAEKVNEFRGKTFRAAGFPPRQCPWHRKIAFLCFPPGPGISPSAHGPKWARKPLNRFSRPVGVQLKKKPPPRKLWMTVQDSVVAFFSSISGPLWLRGPAGLVAACLLAAAAACWTRRLRPVGLIS